MSNETNIEQDDSMSRIQSIGGPASYVIIVDGDFIYAKNERTGAIDYSGTDAATVIQAAMDALNVSGLGGRILLPNEKLELTATLIGRSYVGLVGQSTMYSGASTLRLTGSQSEFINMSNVHGMVLENLSIVGEGTGKCLNINGSGWNKFRNLYINNFDTGLYLDNISIWNDIYLAYIRNVRVAASLNNHSNHNWLYGGLYYGSEIGIDIEESDGNQIFSPAISGAMSGWTGIKLAGAGSNYNMIYCPYIETVGTGIAGNYGIYIDDNANKNVLLQPRFNLTGSGNINVRNADVTKRNSWIQDGTDIVNETICPHRALIPTLSSIAYSMMLNRSDNINGADKVAYFNIPIRLNSRMMKAGIYFSTDDAAATCKIEILAMGHTAGGVSSLYENTIAGTGLCSVSGAWAVAAGEMMFIRVTVKRNAGTYAYIWSPMIEGHAGYLP